jgi:general secretion pathway protein G
MRAWEENMNCGFRIDDCGLKKTSGATVRSGIRHSKSRRAFTLIELMLVLVILATLAAIVTPRLTGQSKRAKIIAAQTQIADLGTALDAFEIGVGRYPTTVEGLLALIQQPTSEATEWQGPYLNKNNVPLDPWGNEYQYRCPGQYNPDGYDLYSYGPDGKQGGDDDISNWSEDVRR